MIAEAIDRVIEMVTAAKLGVPTKASDDGDPFVMVPSQARLHNLADFMPPKRIKRSVTLNEASSFVDYVNRFKREETMIFATVNPRAAGAVFKAILDYHAPAPALKPNYCDHCAVFNMIPTPEWETWINADRSAMDQLRFATWLEDNQKLFVEPSGAELLELVRSLHGHKNARFTTAIRLDNGAHSASYDEDVQVRGTTTTKAGDIELPPVIAAGIAVFQGAEAYKVTARLKCRVENRQLLLFFETIGAHTIIRESILLAVQQVAKGTGIVPLIGNT